MNWNDQAAWGVELDELASLVFWSGGGLWAAGRQWLRPKERTKTRREANKFNSTKLKKVSELMKWNESNWLN